MLNKKKLIDLRKKYDFTQLEVANKLNISQSRYSRIEKSEKNIELRTLERIAKVFNTTVEYLTDTEILPIYQKLNDENKKSAIKFVKDKYLKQEQEEKIIYLKEKLIPYEVISDSSLSAGYGNGYDDTQETYTVYWDEDINYDYAIAISGESMKPDYYDGDIALVRKRYTYDYDNRVCAIDDIENGKLYIKKIHINTAEGTVTLESLNKQTYDNGELMYPDITLENTENLKLIGLVVDSFTPLEFE